MRRRAWLIVGLLVSLSACTGGSPPEATESTPTNETAATDETVVTIVAPEAPEADTGDESVPAPEELTPLATPVPPATPTPRPTPVPTATPIPPGQAVAPTRAELARALSAYRAAARGRDLDGALRAQRDLLAAAERGEGALKGDRSRPAEGLLAAIASVRAGVAGDGNALDRAEAALGQPTAGLAAATTPGAAATTPGAEPGGSLDALNEKLRGFRQALRDRNVDGAMRLQGDLLAALGPAERAAAQDQSEKGRAL